VPYAYAAAAEAAGFRPCLQCRPDRTPEPGWIDAPELVCRALRLIADGALDGDTEDGLALRLGVSARHLRRLFADHVGATPNEVARSRRAHFARRLLDDTDMPMTRVATAAGFQSVRHMNRVVKQVFRFTPKELRAKRRDPRRLVADGGLELRLPYRPPLAWTAMLAFLAPRAIPGVEYVDLDAAIYRRTLRVGGEPAVVEVSNDEDARNTALELRVHLNDCKELVHVVALLRRLFDLDLDPDVVDAHLARDPALRPLVRAQRGLRVPGAVDPLEIGTRAILGQQVTVGHATRCAGRLVERYGTPVAGLEPLGLGALFPTRAELASAPLDDIGVTGARAAAIRNYAATAVPLDGSLGLEPLVRRLERIPGVGPWTAHYVAMRGAGERDAYPATDLGLRHAFGGDPGATLAAAEGARPWRAYVAMHVWSSDGSEIARGARRAARSRQSA
jgi:AraC family transcriptional regulator of adaptative response / DNA-3-methyladenine glycosylase II